MAATTPDSPANRFKEEVRATIAAFLHLARTRLCTVRTVAVCLFGGVFLLQVFFALYLNYFSSTEKQFLSEQPALLEKKLLSDSSGKQTQSESGGDLHGGLGAGLGLETPGGGAHTSRPGAALSQMAWQMGRSMFAQWLRFGHDQQQVDCIPTGGTGDGPSGGGGERKEVNLDSPAAGGLGLLSDDGDDVAANRPSTKVAGSADKSASTSQLQSGAAETTGSAAAERTKPKGDYSSHEPELSGHAPGAQGVANHDEGGHTTATASNSKQPRTTRTNRDPKIDYVNSGDAAHTGGSRINFNDIAKSDPDKRKLLVSLISPHSDRGEVVKHICSVLWTLPQGKRTEKPFPTQTTPQRAMGAARRLAAKGLTSTFQEHEVLAEMRRRERHTQDEAALFAFADAEEGSRSDRKSSNLESWARVDSKLEQLETIGRASFRLKYPLLATAAAAADVTSGHLGSFARALMESLRPAVRHLMGAVAGTETEGAGEERRLEGVTFSAEDAAVDGADGSRLRDPAQAHGNRSERKLQRQATEEEDAHAVEIPVFDPREASAKKGSAGASVQKELDESGKLWRDPSGGVHYIVYLIPPHRASAADARIGLDGAHQGGGGLKWVTKPPRGGGKAGRRRLGAAEQSAAKPPDTTTPAPPKSDGEESAITRYAQLVRLFEEIRQVSNHILFDLCGPPVFAGLRRLSDLSFVYDSDVLLPQLIRAKLPNVDHVAVLTEKMFVQSGDIFQDLHTVKEYGSGVSLVPEAVNVNEEASERVGKSRRAGQNRMSTAELGRLAREVRVDSLLTNQLEWMTEEATKAVDHRGVGSRRQLSTTAAGGSKLNSEYGVDPGFSYYHSQHYAYSDYEDNIFVWGPRSASGKSSAASVGPESRVSSRKSSWAKCVVEADRGSLTFLDPHAAEQEQEQSGSGGPRSSPPAQLTSTDLAASTADDVVEISSSLAFLFGRTPEVLRYLHGLDFLLERCGSYVFSQAADAGRATIDGMHSRLLRYFAHHPVPGADLIWAEPAGYLFGMSWSSKQIRSTDPAPLYLQYPLLYNGLSNFGQHLRSESIRVGPCKIFRQTKNVDIRGSDLPGPTAASAKVDIVACQAACNAEHDCDTFVWLPANKMCYLKTRARLATPTEKQGLILAQCTHERT
eukprot:g12744.t1